jgi:hypothetical protein
MTKALRDWVPRVSSYRDASHLQEPVDAIRDLQRAGGGPKYPSALPFEHGYGRVVAKGPGGEADGTNAVYWVQRLMMGPADWTVPPNLLPDSSEQINNDSPPNIFPATHLAERYTGRHELAADGTVEVFFWADFDTDDPPNKHYLFIADQAATGIKFGKLAASWPAHADHNLVDLTPCVSASDISAYVQTPLGSTPAFFAVNSGEIVAYFTDTDGNNILIHAPVPGSNALYDLPQITSIVGGLGVGGCGPLRAQ